jgi:filamentous hemagglutinin family protein
MTQSESGRCWKLALASSLAISTALASFEDCALAQIRPDSTLEAESSVVTPNVIINGLPSDRIDGGAIRGVNLFHSFQEFNVDAGRGAYFTSPAGIENILSRVTGGNRSNIQGTLGVSGNANLFLINPNGIIFGPNASLDINGSFLASTASSLNFADGSQFSATAPQTQPLLTVSVPTGLQFGATPGSIVNQSQASPNSAKNGFGLPVGLQVPTGKTLALVGGNVALEGGNITAEGGRIELGSVAGSSLVSLSPTDQGFVLGYEGIKNFQNIQLTKQTVGGAEIPSFVTTQTLGAQDAGDITINTRRLVVRDGSQITTESLGVFSFEPPQFIPATGRAGNLAVNASESVELIGTSSNGEFRSSLVSATASAGDAGNITINTRRLLIQDGATVLTESSGLLLLDGQFIPATGRAGNLTVNASESVELIGTSLVDDRNSSGLSSATASAKQAGDITLNTGRLLIENGAEVSAITVDEGRAGNLKVTATESVELSGRSPDGVPSRLLAEASNLAPQFKAPEVTGQGGDLMIATGKLIIRDGAVVTVSSEGTGKAGELNVTARSILLDNKGTLTAETTSGQGGNITLQAGDVRLRHESYISTTAGTLGNPGNGGQITINTDTLVGLENSDITANAFEGNGGFIQIAAQGVFGLERREQLTGSSDITAFSEKNPELPGVVEINTPDVDPSRGIVNLPEEVVDVTGLIAQGCSAGGGKADRGSSEFTVTGRGGLPPTPREALSSDTVLEDWGTLALTSVQPLRLSQHDARENRSGSPAVATYPTRPKPAPLVEASGWVIDAKGEVILTATAPTATPHSPWLPPATCHGF